MKLSELIENGCDFAYRVRWSPGDVIRINVPTALIFYRDNDPAPDLKLTPSDITADDWLCGEHLSPKEEKKRRREQRDRVIGVSNVLLGRSE